jgi:hypothetical protein
MEPFSKLRLKAAKALLAGKVSKTKRKRSYINFPAIKSIGLVWDASKPEDFLILSGFCQKMSNLKIEVKILGYFPGRNLPDQYTAVRYLTCLKRQEVSFFYKPVSQDAAAFIARSLDVLIDINFRKLFPLVYITSLSNARFKVGLADSKPESAPFDLMISMKKPVNLSGYLEQVLYYLDMIKSGPAKEAV